MDVTEHGHYIAGKQVPAAAEARFEVLDPATNRPIARVASGGKREADAPAPPPRRASQPPDGRDRDPRKRGRCRRLPGAQAGPRWQRPARREALTAAKPLR